MVLVLPRLVLAEVSIPTGTGLPEGSGSDHPVVAVLENILNWMLGIIGVLALISFVISGIIYLTSVGDSGQAETAKKAMMYSILGIVVALSGFVVLKAVETMLWANEYDF